MKIKFLFPLVLVLTIYLARGQDPLFTQSNYIQETLNPGFSGFEDNNRVYAGVISRLQWPKLDLKLTTQYAFVNMSYDYGPGLGYGIGINAVWQYETFNHYNYYQINANYAHRVNLNNDWFFRPGIEIGVGNKSNSFRNLTLADQINIDTGTINPITLDPFYSNTINPYFFDVSAGLVFEKLEFRGTSYWFGASVKHLNRPNISFVEGQRVPLDIFYSIHGNYRFPFLLEHSIMMTANYMQQNRFNRLDIGVIYQIDLLLLGLTAVTNPAKNGNNSRLLTSINAFVGLEFEELRFGFSYDMNTSNIGYTSGVYEITLTYLSRCRNCSLNRRRKR